MDAAPDKTTARKKRRSRDNNRRTKTGKEGAERFIQELASESGKGAITRAAQKAFPNQKPRSAAATGSRLLQDPYVADRVNRLRNEAALAAGLDRTTTLYLLGQMAVASLADFQNDEGEFDWSVAKERGIDHLVQEEEITIRHSNTGASRTTRKYKLPSRLHAIDLIAELTGWKKAPAKNPIDAARELYAVFRAKPQFADLPDERLIELAARTVKVNPEDLIIQLPAA